MWNAFPGYNRHTSVCGRGASCTIPTESHRTLKRRVLQSLDSLFNHLYCLSMTHRQAWSRALTGGYTALGSVHQRQGQPMWPCITSTSVGMGQKPVTSKYYHKGPGDPRGSAKTLWEQMTTIIWNISTNPFHRQGKWSMERSGGNKLDTRVFLPQNHSCSPNGEILSKGPSAKPHSNTFQTNKRKCSFKWHPQMLLEAGPTQTIKGPP